MFPLRIHMQYKLPGDCSVRPSPNLESIKEYTTPEGSKMPISRGVQPGTITDRFKRVSYFPHYLIARVPSHWKQFHQSQVLKIGS